MRIAIGLMLLAAPQVVADGPTLEQLHIGKAVIGTTPKLSDFKGKVLLVEEFGLQCGPCMAAMPHIVQWHDELSEFGLVVVAVHRQQGTADQIRDRCAAFGVRFTVCEVGSIGGSEYNGLPHCALFTAAGKCDFDGPPSGVESKLRSAVGTMLAADIDKPTKAMQPVVDGLKRGGSVFDSLKKLQTLKSSGEKATVEQAKALSEKILDCGRRRLDAVKAEQKDDPVAAYFGAAGLAARWKGYETGTKAAELAAKLKVDKVVVAELKARPALEAIKKLDAAISNVVKDDDFTSADFKKKYGPQVKDMKRAFDAMKRNYPDARSTKEAEVLVGKYDLAPAKK